MKGVTIKNENISQSIQLVTFDVFFISLLQTVTIGKFSNLQIFENTFEGNYFLCRIGCHEMILSAPFV